MTDPRKLLDDGPDQVTLNLLRSALDDDPSPRALERTAAALGASGLIQLGTGAAAAKAAGSGATGGAKLGGVLALKWLGIGATVGLLTAGGAELARRASTPVTAPSLTAPAGGVSEGAHERRATVPISQANATAEEPVHVERAPAVATGGALPAKPHTPTIGAEITALDRARGALRRNDPGAALAAIDELERGGTLAFGPEAKVLRAEALLALGQRTEAVALARCFIQENPASPHVERMRQIAAGVP